ncbi:hypothetical protein HDZ31DRAFT_40943 [Schizophyllum fasciatum]
MPDKELGEDEKWWAARQPWLLSRGYELRPRYRPGWTPSWLGTPQHRMYAEDAECSLYPSVLDAVRIDDRRPVMLKRVDLAHGPSEIDMIIALRSPPLSTDPRNHCTPLLDVLHVPDSSGTRIMVLPLLHHYSNPRFDTVGEAIGCILQITECVQFLHENKIAHRDVHLFNIMMDAFPLSDIPFHPMRQAMRRDLRGKWRAKYTRTERPVRYYLIDYGNSTRYESVDPPPLETPILPGDKSVPEFVGDDPSRPFSGLAKPHNPFPADIYCLGNWIRQEFLDVSMLHSTGRYTGHSRRIGMEFLRPLVNDMVQADPFKRPTIDEVVTRLETIVFSLTAWKLRSRIAKAGDTLLYSTYLAVTHWARCARFVITRRPAVPSPSI